LPRFQPFVGLFPLAFVDRDSVGPEDFAVDIAVCEVGASLEHICRQAPPHHQFDHALGDALVDQVCDTVVAEDVRGDVFLYPGPPDPLVLSQLTEAKKNIWKIPGTFSKLLRRCEWEE